MPFSAWNRELGTTQGRIAPVGFLPPEGSFAFVLGRDLPGERERFRVGDFVEVRQTGNFGSAHLLRACVRTRGASTLPDGFSWRLSLLIDGSEGWSTTLDSGRLRDRYDLAANVSKLTGDHELAFRLLLDGPSGADAVEVELPAAYLDTLVLDPTPTRPVLIDRDPEPGEVQVPIGSTIAFDITDVGPPSGDIVDTQAFVAGAFGVRGAFEASGLFPSSIDLSSTRVFVEGALAFDDRTFQAGFDGSRSAVQTLAPDSVRIVVDPTTPFSSLEAVAIRVESRTLGGDALDMSYAFTCQDLTPPRIVGVQARELTLVRVSFDEAVKQDDPSASDDALNPALYTLTPRSAPAVSVNVVSVLPVTSSGVDVVTDLPLSPGATYTLDVTGVADLFGNQITQPVDATFNAFVPARPAARRFALWSLLPELNRREDETGDLHRFIACLEEVTDLLLFDIDRFVDILDPDIAAESYLDLMLADLGSPFPFELSAVDKRRLLNILVAIYREKGTAAGIKNAVRFFLGFEVAIDSYAGEALVLGDSTLGEDWILGPSGSFSAYAFEVSVQRALADEERRRLRQIVDYMKPAHTHFVWLVEPTTPEVIDHLELGVSELGENWILH